MVSAPRIGQVLPSTTNDADPIPPTYIAELSADKIVTGVLSGAVVTVGDDGVIKAGIGSTTVEVVKEGIYGYVENAEVFRLANGELFVKGTIEADDGYFAGDLVGNAIFGATIDGSAITGGTISIGSGDAVFRASQLGIQLGSGNWLTAPFTVDATGRLKATDATISGTIQSAAAGGRTVITRSTVNGYQVGRVEFWTGLEGETPSALTSTRRTNTGNVIGTELALESGYDPVFASYGPRMQLRVERYVPTLPPFRLIAMDADQVNVTGELNAQNESVDVSFDTARADHYYFDLNSTPGTPGVGHVRIWRDAVGVQHIQGSMRASVALTSGAVVGHLPDGYGPVGHSRFITGLVNGTEPVEFEVTSQTSATAFAAITYRSAVTIAANDRVELHGALPRVEQPMI